MALAPPADNKLIAKIAFIKILENDKVIQFLAGQNVACQ